MDSVAGATTRQRLVDAAFDLFAERGYDATTVEDIAARAGLGRTTFFRNFRSKEQVVFPDHDRLLAAISARLQTATTETSVVAIYEAAGLVLRHYIEEGELARRRYRLTRSVEALRERERAGIPQYERLFTLHIHSWLGGEPDTRLRAELVANAVVTAHNHVLRRWLRDQTATAQDARRHFYAAMQKVDSLFRDWTPSTDPPSALAHDVRPAVIVVRDASGLDALLPTIRSMLD